MYSRILLGVVLLIYYNVESIYQIHSYLCIIQTESIPAICYDEAIEKLAYYPIPSIRYVDSKLVMDNERNKKVLSSSHFLRIIKRNGNDLSYENFLSQLKELANRIGQKELPFTSITASVRKATF